MASCMRNITFLSSSLTKLATNSNKSIFTRLHCVSPKHYHSGPVINSIRCSQNKHYKFCLLAVRHASTEASNLPPGYIPDIPLTPLEDITPVLPKLNALGEPTLQSLGLGSNYPAGLVQQFLESLHVFAELPWWGAIALGAVTMRVFLFPVMIFHRKASSHIRVHMPTVTRLQEKITNARVTGDTIEVNKKMTELADYIKRNDVKLRRMVYMPLIQAPILLSVFRAILGMGSLPVESMKTGGLSWFTDLTVSDPYFILPATAALSIFFMFELGAESQKTADLSHGMKWVMRCMPIFIFVITSKFTAAVSFYWSVNNIISLLCVAILRTESAKRLFKLPKDVIHHKKEIREKKGFVEGFRQMYDTSKSTKQIMQRREFDERAFKKAGVGPVPKTYRYNPKTVAEKDNTRPGSVKI